MSRSPRSSPRPLHLIPFGLLAVSALAVLTGWWTGHATWVQPRSYDAPLPANAAAGLGLIGLAPCLLSLQWRRLGLGLAFAASLLGLATLLQQALKIDLGVDYLLAGHTDLVAGPHVARMPPALALVCTLAGLLLCWFAARPDQPRLPLLAGFLGSVTLAYALTGLLAYRNGLNFSPTWQEYAQLGPHTSLLLALLGLGLVWRAANLQPSELSAGPRWLWVPVTVCGLTLTLSFWLSLRNRESTFLRDTTQLTMDTVAALFNDEVASRVDSLQRLAERMAQAEHLTSAVWEKDAGALVRDFAGYRSVQFIDPFLHTRWYWPHEGNEDSASLDHATQPIRRNAALAAHREGTCTIAAPVANGASPSFAIYAPVGSRTAAVGFVVGEVYFDRIFATIERRLKLAEHYQITVVLEPAESQPGPSAPLPLYHSTAGEDRLDPALQISASYKVLSLSLGLTLTPRPALVEASRHHLPELALASGIGLSLLLGLVAHLTQTAVLRQRIAEKASHQLRQENVERRQIAAQLKSADERLNLAFESTHAGVIEWNLENDEVFCTPSVWKMIGATPETMPTTGTGWLNLLHPDDRPAVRSAIDAHFRGETPFIEIEHCVHLPSGEWLWLAFRAKCTTYSATRQPRRVLGTVQNINLRKRVDEALRASQAETRKLSLVASKTDNIVVIANAGGLIEWTNESFTRLTGYKPAEIVGQPLLDQLVNAGDSAPIRDRLAMALAAGQAISTEAVQRAADGHEFHISLEIQPVHDEDGTLENFLAIATDISARIETERQLRRAKEEADLASRSKSEFLASMSHEIRTPMNGVIGMTSLLQETGLSPEQRDYVSTIRTSGDALLSIIDDILDFSKIESGRMELQSQPFDLGQCVEEVVDHFSAQAATKGIELAFTIDPGLPACVLGDVSHLRQILHKLFSNGLKFTPSGSVCLEVTGTPAGPHPAGQPIELAFHVIDTGIGIPVDQRHRLFQPFTQIDSSSTRKFGGTGLGLAISHRLCQMMGGNIEVLDSPEGGTYVRFTIQSSAVTLDATEIPPTYGELPVTGAILAVDDLRVNRLALERNLRSWKQEPHLAASLAEAQTILAASAGFIVAIVDQELGEAAGLNPVASIRSVRPTLPIILLTPTPTSLKRLDVTDPLVFRLAKPIKAYALHAVLRRALSSGLTPAGQTTSNSVRLAESIPLDILLVEDNPVNRKVAHGYLERLGYKAATATNGREAVTAAMQQRFHLVFMDLQMPELDGLGATREIRSQGGPDNQPLIVALTANALQGDREACLAAGMNDYLTKPLRLEDLSASIQRNFGPKSG